MTSPISNTLLRIDLDRLKDDILELSKIGWDEASGGIYRQAFTDADMEGKRWLMQRIEAAGLTPQMDGAGNITARLGVPNRPSILIGSHIDTVPCAGALDGTLGVMIGLETLRVLKESGTTLHHPIELVSFSDEEGRFGGMFGSQAFCGKITPHTLRASTDMDGISLESEMRRHGLDPLAALSATRAPETVKAYLELHIEQGPVLDRLGKQVGIVEDITGLFKWQIRLHGVANHAGTTPMDMRNDAFMGLADFAHELPRILDENGSERSRATIGKAQILPGSPNTVPGLVEFSIDVRDTDNTVLEELKDACRKALSAIARRRELKFDFQEASHLRPVACADQLVNAVETQARALKLDYLRMPSGAAHDAQIMGSLTPIAMIFVPSKGGKSHSPDEWTAWQDIEAGANLVLNTLTALSCKKE